MFLFYVPYCADSHVCVLTAARGLIFVILKCQLSKGFLGDVLCLLVCSCNLVEHKYQRDEKPQNFSVPHIFTRMTSRWLILNSICGATETMESVRFTSLVQAGCPQRESAQAYLKIMEATINSLVWKIIFSSKSRLCQIDQWSYGCCLVRQEEEKLWRDKEFFSLKYKNCVINV